jgi:hypothetical protein
LPADARVETISEGGGLLRALTDDETQSREGRVAQALPEVARQLAGDAPLAAFAASVLPLASGDRAVCALPFALLVR